MGGNPCYSLVWLIILVFIAWPLAIFITPFWLFLQPLEAFCSLFADINGVLERFVTWPRTLGSAIADCSSNCPQP